MAFPHPEAGGGGGEYRSIVVTCNIGDTIDWQAAGAGSGADSWLKVNGTIVCLAKPGLNGTAMYPASPPPPPINPGVGGLGGTGGTGTIGFNGGNGGGVPNVAPFTTGTGGGGGGGAGPGGAGGNGAAGVAYALGLPGGTGGTGGGLTPDFGTGAQGGGTDSPAVEATAVQWGAGAGGVAQGTGLTVPGTQKGGARVQASFA